MAGRSAVAVLIAAGSCALGVAVPSTAAVLSGKGPERCCAAVSGTSRVTPTPLPSTTRPAGPPLCLIGSWRTVDETFMVEFYTDVPAIRFTGKGREFEFRPDGTVVEKQHDVVLSGTYQGNEVRMVGNGTSELTWTATDRAITYPARTRTDITWASYDQRGLIGTQPASPDLALDEVDEYVCSGDTVVETGVTGYTSHWVRTSVFGVYG